MVGNATNCAQIRELIFDAAAEALSGNLRAAFDAHLSGCAACAKEFQQMHTLAQAIDRSLSATLSIEPSPQLISNVRREMSAAPHRATWSRKGTAWLTAAGVCAAFAILVLAVRSAREFNRPTHDSTVASINVPSTPKPIVHPRVNAPMQAAATAAQPRKPALAVVSHTPRRASHERAAEPEIIVEPGQMEAILQLVGATQSGQIDGAKLLVDQKKAAEPLEIEPLVIAPLKIATLGDETLPASRNGESDDKDFVAGHLN